ncbi:MAG: hypothetical protein ACF8R7_12515 [Phycisphaerales bacterium JB039]
MSYDLRLFRTADGVSLETLTEAIELHAEDDGPNPAPMLRPISNGELATLHAALRAAEPSLEGPTDELFGGDDLPITISLMSDEVGYSIPYWYEGAEARETVMRIAALLAICREHGLRIYDPQIGREIIDPQAELAQITDVYTYGTRSLRSVLARRPWWKFW